MTTSVCKYHINLELYIQAFPGVCKPDFNRSENFIRFNIPVSGREDSVQFSRRSTMSNQTDSTNLQEEDASFAPKITEEDAAVEQKI